jgi:hypothetical protein
MRGSAEAVFAVAKVMPIDAEVQRLSVNAQVIVETPEGWRQRPVPRAMASK